MFDKKEDKAVTRGLSPRATTSLPEDVVIRVMPRLEKDEDEVTIQTAQAPTPAVMRSPIAPPMSQQTLASIPTPTPIQPPRPKKRRWWVSAMLFLLIIASFFAVLLVYQEYFIPRIGNDSEPTNTTLSAPQPTIPTPTIPEPEPPQEITLLPGLDTDSDGLTDREEALYSTDLRNPDTDADSFLDGNEVFHRFDPLGLAPSTLLDNGTVVQFEAEATETSPRATLTYPITWTPIETTPSLGWNLALQPLTSSRISIQEIPLGGGDAELTLSSHLEQRELPESFRTPLSEFLKGTSKNGYSLFTHPSGRLVYLSTPSHLYEFYYDVRTERTIEYLQTFQMIINSFMQYPL